jgi:hypothetical protein
LLDGPARVPRSSVGHFRDPLPFHQNNDSKLHCVMRRLPPPPLTTRYPAIPAARMRMRGATIRYRSRRGVPRFTAANGGCCYDKKAGACAAPLAGGRRSIAAAGDGDGDEPRTTISSMKDRFLRIPPKCARSMRTGSFALLGWARGEPPQNSALSRVTNWDLLDLEHSTKEARSASSSCRCQPVGRPVAGPPCRAVPCPALPCRIPRSVPSDFTYSKDLTPPTPTWCSIVVGSTDEKR